MRTDAIIDRRQVMCHNASGPNIVSAPDSRHPAAATMSYRIVTIRGVEYLVTSAGFRVTLSTRAVRYFEQLGYVRAE